MALVVEDYRNILVSPSTYTIIESLIVNSSWNLILKEYLVHNLVVMPAVSR